MITDALKQDVLARTDLVSVISPHVRLKKAGGRFYGLCPFHEEKSPSFAVHVAKQFYYCFGCGASGDAIGFLMDHLGMKYGEAVKQLADLAGLVIPKDGGPPTPRHVIQRRIDAEVMLECMEHELLICAITTADYHNGLDLSAQDRARFIEATTKITRAIEYVKKRRLFDYERRQLVSNQKEQEKRITA